MKVLQMHASSDEKKANIRGVIFDLDGTLVDSAPDLAKALNYCLKNDGLAPFDVLAVRDLVGHGAGAMLRRGYLLREGRELAGERFDRRLKSFLDYYVAHIADESRPFKGVQKALDVLKNKGLKLGICTNKPHAMALALLQALGWTDVFDAIIGGDVLGLKKPDPHHIFAVAKALDLAPGACLFVGDSEIDYEAGRNANMRTIIVSFGYSQMPLEDMHGAFKLDSYADLEFLLSSF